MILFSWPWSRRQSHGAAEISKWYLAAALNAYRQQNIDGTQTFLRKAESSSESIVSNPDYIQLQVQLIADISDGDQALEYYDKRSPKTQCRRLPWVLLYRNPSVPRQILKELSRPWRSPCPRTERADEQDRMAPLCRRSAQLPSLPAKPGEC